MDQTYIDAPDGHKIQVLIWPNPNATAWVHILHGMAEHCARYDRFAMQLVAAGYAVVAHNHRGHGSSPSTTLGQYAETDGWQKVLSDIDVVRDTYCGTELPYYLMGHSMGSFIAQSYMTRIQRPIDALILSGSNYQSPALTKAGLMVAKFERWRLGADKSSKLLQFLSFGSFNNAFKPNRTDFDWLSKNHDEVDKYINDPLCGFNCHTQLWIDFLQALLDLTNASAYAAMQKDLPIYILGGDKDPVGESGKGLPKLESAFRKAGQSNVTLSLYHHGRHEMLNESNSEEVMSDTINWLNALQLRS